MDKDRTPDPAEQEPPPRNLTIGGAGSIGPPLTGAGRVAQGGVSVSGASSIVSGEAFGTATVRKDPPFLLREQRRPGRYTLEVNDLTAAEARLLIKAIQAIKTARHLADYAGQLLPSITSLARARGELRGGGRRPGRAVTQDHYIAARDVLLRHHPNQADRVRALTHHLSVSVDSIYRYHAEEGWPL